MSFSNKTSVGSYVFFLNKNNNSNSAERFFYTYEIKYLTLKISEKIIVASKSLLTIQTFDQQNICITILLFIPKQLLIV